MIQLLIDTAFAARQRFPGRPIRLWQVMLARRSWRAIVINTATKAKLAEGPVRSTQRAALVALRSDLERAARARGAR